MNKEAMATYKKIILYFIHHLELAPTNSQITDFLLTKKYVTYFNAQQALSELIQDGYLVKKNDKEGYEITDEGIRILMYSPNEPSKTIRKETLSYIEKQHGRLKLNKSTPANYMRQADGSYIATLSLTKDNNLVFSVSIACPDEDSAQNVCLDWHKKCPDTYALLLEQLINQKES